MSPEPDNLAAGVLRKLERVSLTGRELAVGGIVALAVLGLASEASWLQVLLSLTLAVVAMAAAAHVDRARQAVGSNPMSGQSATVLQGRELLAPLLRGLPDAAMLVDGRLTIVDANEAARQAFAISPGRPLIQATRAPELLQAVDAALQQGETQALQLQLPPPQDRTFMVRIVPVGNDRGGHQSTALILLRDMTEQEQLSRMRADFVANASHELRTPLASLKGFIETLQGPAKNDPAAQERFLGIMQEQASRMSRLISDLLSLSRIEMREHVAPTGKVELPAVVEDVITAMKPMAAAAGGNLTAGPLQNPGTVTGDRDELTQVLQNLVQNAIKYGRKGGTTTVELTRDGTNLCLTVRDDGIGIEPRHLPRLTERFYRVSAKDSRERGGTGLGLAIVKHIVARHRGELRIASVPGRGSTFTVVISAASPPAA